MAAKKDSPKPKKRPTTGTADPDRRVLVELVPLDKLTEDPRNSRRHPVRNIEAIKSSLVRFGQQKPIVVRHDGVIVAGNGTFQAARELGWTELAVVRTGLDERDASAYAIADNRTAELAAWDFEALGNTLGDLREQGMSLEDMGFTEQEYEDVFSDGWKDSFKPAKTGEGAGDDEEDNLYSVRVDGVKPEDKERIVAAVAKAIEGSGYECKAY